MSEEEDRRKLENTMKRREREIGREEGITLGIKKTTLLLFFLNY